MTQGNAFWKTPEKHSTEKRSVLNDTERKDVTEALVKGFRYDYRELIRLVLDLAEGDADLDGYKTLEKAKIQKRKDEEGLSRYKVTKANKELAAVVDAVQSFSEQVVKAVKSGKREAIISTVSDGLKDEAVKKFFKHVYSRFPVDQDPRPLIEQPPVLFVNSWVVSTELDYRRLLRLARRQKAMDAYQKIVSAWYDAKADRRAEIENSKLKVED